MEKTIEIPEGYEARIEGNKVIIMLKESEDERIRKAIKMYVEDMPDTFGFAHGIVKEDMLAYLERQKECGPLSKDEEYTLARIIEYLEDNDCPSKWKDLLHDVYLLPYQKDQKPAEWNEEDERMLSRCIKSIETSKQFADSDTFKKAKDNEISWLKSLRPQLKAEWNWQDEDFEKFRDVLAKEAFLDEITSVRVAKKLLGFLKHYRSQPHWKPSEEQIDDLQMLLDDLNKLDNKNNVKMIKVFHWSENYKNLKGLLDSLKKL